MDVTRCQSLAADMASQQLAPISVHGSVKFRDHTCIVTEIWNQHGFRTFQLQDLDKGEIVQAFRFQLKMMDSGPLITELPSDFEMGVAEETATNTQRQLKIVSSWWSCKSLMIWRRSVSLRQRKDRGNGQSMCSKASTCQCLATYWFLPQLGREVRSCTHWTLSTFCQWTD